MADTDEQSAVGACCFSGTPGDSGMEFDACPEYVRAVGPVRCLVAFKKHIKRRLAGVQLVWVTVLERPR
jgi:hypothetical protein